MHTIATYVLSYLQTQIWKYDSLASGGGGFALNFWRLDRDGMFSVEKKGGLVVNGGYCVCDVWPNK